MNAPVGFQSGGTNLPDLVERASRALASARNAGEVLEARDQAQLAYDAAKCAGRMARAKKAHDEVLAAVYRAQADALLIEARAKVRLADEFDAAQARGEVASLGTNQHRAEGVAISNTLGLRRDQIHEARQFRDAELRLPGLFAQIVHEAVAAGREPTKALIRGEVERARRSPVCLASGDHEWNTPREFVEAARAVMGRIALDPASSQTANLTVKAERFFSAADDGLAQKWVGPIFMNPPYGAPLIAQFVERFAASGLEGVVLVNSATETRWFQRLISVASAVCFPSGRISFVKPGRAGGQPLQGQAIIYRGPAVEAFKTEFERFGFVAVLK